MEHATKISAASEVWRPVEGYEGLYDVSNLARVRSWYVGGRVMKPQFATNGYYTINLHKNKQQFRTLVHRLVAKAFVPNPNNLPEVNHKDCCKTNNMPDNLEWCDRVYNVNYADAREKQALLRGRRVEQLTKNGEHVAFYDSAKQASRMSNGAFKYSNINRALAGRQQRKGSAYGYLWRYL